MFHEGVSSPLLKNWLDWVGGNSPNHFIALPMIQRGSVWKPNQIVTLWDSLLRGMPIGSLLLSRFGKDSEGNQLKVRRVGESQLIDVPSEGGFALLDGQQRTLAMLLGWPDTVDQKRILWVDFADKPIAEHLFRLHLTTTANPYGFRKADPNVRLTLAERREARSTAPIESESCPLPWDSHLPVPLTTLIRVFLKPVGNYDHKGEWVRAVRSELQLISHRGKSFKDFDVTDENLARFYSCLERAFALHIPLIEVRQELFEHDQQGDDPALAILFKRVGTLGTALSDSDYVYSVIKHQLPETFQLVEDISVCPGFPRMLGPRDIVMTAVRLVAAELEKSNDYESPQKSDFDRLRRNPEFLQNFLELIKSGRLTTAFNALTEGLRYRGTTGDNGLPLHGFVLVPRPVLQVLLRWLLLQDKQLSTPAESANLTDIVVSSREELLRFVLYANVAVPDIRRASLLAFSWLHDHASTRLNFPGQELVRYLVEERLRSRKDCAFQLPSARTFETLALKGSNISTELNNGLDYEESERTLLGWERFIAQPEDEGEPIQSQYTRGAEWIFKKWWGLDGHRHPLLLWLQRKYVNDVENYPEEVRDDDETPYDYDHICPSNHWYNWTGIASGDRLIDFLAQSNNGGHWRIGNAIGNVRVWYANDNRSYGDMTAVEKLTSQSKNTKELLDDSAIQNFPDWEACSGKGSSVKWSAKRAYAFQRAVEQRTFDLYKAFLKDLKYESEGWLCIVEATTPPNVST